MALLTSTTGAEFAASAASVAAAKAALGVTTPTTITGTTTTLVQADDGKEFLIGAATAITVNLPAPVPGTSLIFTWTVAPSSATHKIITDAATTFLQGLFVQGATGAATSVFNGNGSTHRAVNLDGATKGGGIGTKLRFRCITATQWEVDGLGLCVGSAATPFATS